MARPGQALTQRITRDPNVMVGKPVIKGTRIPVDRVLAHLARNPDLSDQFAAYPELTIEDVKAVLAYALASVERERAGERVARSSALPRPLRSDFSMDQSADARLVAFLVGLGHDATRIGAGHPSGLPDPDVLAIARQERRILVTDDRDFGELVIRRGHPHAGVIFLRLGDDADLATRMDRLDHVISAYRDRLDRFLVVTRTGVRVRAGSGREASGPQ